MDLEVDNINVEFKSNICQENVAECLSLSFTKFVNGNSATSDVTIVCHDGRIPAHKLVVASISPMLYNSMKNVEQEERIWIFIPDFSVQELKQYLQCVYSLQDCKQCSELKRTLGVVPYRVSVPIEEDPVSCNDEYRGKNNKIIEEFSYKYNKHWGVETKTSDEADNISETESKAGIITLKKVTCHVCEEQFASNSTMKMHIRRRHPEEADKLIPKKLTYLKHPSWESKKDSFLYQYFAREHTDKSRYICNICQTQILEDPYQHKKKMRDHLSAKHNIVKEIIKNYVCSQCGKSFENKYYKNLCEVRHTTGFTTFCEICGKGFYNNNKLDRHRRTHTGETPYQCHVCEEQFAFKSNKNRHIRRKHPEEAHKLLPKKLTCQHCGELMANIFTMKTHIDIRHGDIGTESRKHSEKIDNSDISVPEKIKRPNWEKHKDLFLYQYFSPDPSDESRYICNICQAPILEEPYQHKKKMRDHLSAKHNIVKEIIKNFVCSHCGKSFEKERYKNICEIRHSSGFTNFCEICGKGFYERSLLENHRRTHTGETPYQCDVDVCQKKFKQRSHLKSHMRVHTGETPFECKNCLRKFKFYAIRNSHKCTGRPDFANEL